MINIPHGVQKKTLALAHTHTRTQRLGAHDAVDVFSIHNVKAYKEVHHLCALIPFEHDHRSAFDIQRHSCITLEQSL